MDQFKEKNIYSNNHNNEKWNFLNNEEKPSSLNNNIKKNKKRIKIEKSLIQYQKNHFKNYSIIQYLPIEIMYEILSLFKQYEIVKIGKVCKHWYKCSRENLLWRSCTFEGFKIITIKDCVDLLRAIFIFNKQIPVKRFLFPKSKELILLKTDFEYLRIFLPTIERITLPNVSNYTKSIDDEVLGIISKIQNFKSLGISTHASVTDNGIRSFSIYTKNLTSINLDYCANLTVSSFSDLLQNCIDIRSISCLFCVECRFTNLDLRAISQTHNRLKIVDLGIEVDSNIDLEYLTELKNLLNLRIRGLYLKYGFKITDFCNKMKKLSHLAIWFHEKSLLQGARIEKSNLKEFNAFYSMDIRHLNFFNCQELKKVTFQQSKRIEKIIINECPKLKEINIKGSRLNLTSENLNKMLHSQKALKRFELFDCSGIEEIKLDKPKEKNQIFNNKIEDLSIFMCSDLRTFKIKNNCFKKLKNLNIDSCMRLENLSIDLKNLESCMMFNSPKNSQYPSLLKLKIKSDKIKFLNLQRCVNIQKVFIDCPRLIALNLSDCKHIQLDQLNIYCKNLKKFAISLPSQDQSLTFKRIYSLSKNFPKLAMFNLTNVLSLNDKSIELICSVWVELKALVIKECKNIYSPKIFGSQLKGIEIIGCKNLRNLTFFCKHLNKLFLRYNNNLEDNFISNLNQGTPYLQFLELENCPKVRNSNIIHKHLKSVTVIT